MRIMAWIVLAFTCFMIFVVTMETQNKDEWVNAVSVDGTVKEYTRSKDNLSVHVSYINPFTGQEERQSFAQMGMRSKAKSKYPIKSIHKVWVTESGLKRLQRGRPGGDVMSLFVILALLASLTIILFGFSQPRAQSDESG